MLWHGVSIVCIINPKGIFFFLLACELSGGIGVIESVQRFKFSFNANIEQDTSPVHLGTDTYYLGT